MLSHSALFGHGMLLEIVLSQGLILAVMGYIPGLFISYYLFDLLTLKTGMEHILTYQAASFVLALVCFICVVSALFAIRKLREADPADLFA